MIILRNAFICLTLLVAFIIAVTDHRDPANQNDNLKPLFAAAKKKCVTLERDRIYSFRAKDIAKNPLSHVRLVVGRIAEDENNPDLWNFDAYYFDMGYIGTGPLDEDGDPTGRFKDLFTGANCDVDSEKWVCKTEGKYNPSFKYAGKVAISHFEQVQEVVGAQAEILKTAKGCYNILNNSCKTFAKELAKRIEGSPPPSPGPAVAPFDMEVNADPLPAELEARFEKP